MWLRDVDDRDDAAKLGERVGTAGQGIAADGVEHHIYAMPGGFAHDRFDVILLGVIDHHVGTQAADEIGVGLAHGGEHSGAHGFGHLNRHMADPAGAAVDQNAFANAEHGAHGQRFPNRTADQTQTGRLKVAQRGRLSGDDAFGCDVVLGITALPVEYLRGVPDLVARRESADARADGFNHARHVVTGNGWQRHKIRIVTAANLVIQRIDGSSVHSDQHLARLRNRF